MTGTPLELAILAAQLNPDLCKSEPEAAFLEAIAFVHLAACFLNEHNPWDLLNLYLKSPEITAKQLPLMERAVEKILAAESEVRRGKAQEPEEMEKQSLRFDPRQPTDQVRDFLRVKSERGVKDKLKKWFIRNEREIISGKKSFSDFWKRARKQDGDKTFRLIPKTLLESIREWDRKVKREGGKKSVETKAKRADFSEAEKKTGLRKRRIPASATKKAKS